MRMNPAIERRRIELSLVLHETGIARRDRQPLERLNDLRSIRGVDGAQNDLAAVAQREATGAIRGHRSSCER
jgi:hypothetical protein